MSTVLHVAPHPDDESIGAPCTLLRLADRGHRVVVVACGLGRPAEHHRRRRELAAACATGGLDLLVHDPPVALGSRDDLAVAEHLLTPWLTQLFDDPENDVDLVVSPHLHDAHPAHEAVARAVRGAVAASRRPPQWWSYGIWADLRAPTLLHPCPPVLVERAVAMLACHAGELARNDYTAMVQAAGLLAAVRGVERVLGFGTAALPGVRHAELLTELGYFDGRWLVGVPRVDVDLTPTIDWRADVTPAESP